MSAVASAIRTLHALRGGIHWPLFDAIAQRHYGLGYLPDRRATRLLQVDSREHFTSTQIVEGSLGDFRWSTVIDQNACGSCTAHGSANAEWVSHAANGNQLPFFPSPRLLYGVVRTLELTTANDPLTDSGAMPSDLKATVGKWGIAPIGTGTAFPTPDGYPSDVYFGNVNVKPSLLDLETSGLILPAPPLRIDEMAADFGAQISASIQQKTAMGVGLFVDTTNFMRWNPSTGPIRVINTSDPAGGGHWIELDYIYTLSGEVIVGGLNSWGKDWATPSGAVASPFWKPGGWEMTLSCLRSVCSDCLAYPVTP